MDTAQAAGVAALTGARRGLPVTFHTPSEVKAAVTGSGAADKAQVALMVTRILRLDAAPVRPTPRTPWRSRSATPGAGAPPTVTPRPSRPPGGLDDRPAHRHRADGRGHLRRPRRRRGRLPGPHHAADGGRAAPRRALHPAHHPRGAGGLDDAVRLRRRGGAGGLRAGPDGHRGRSEAGTGHRVGAHPGRAAARGAGGGPQAPVRGARHRAQGRAEAGHRAEGQGAGPVRRTRPTGGAPRRGRRRSVAGAGRRRTAGARLVRCATRTPPADNVAHLVEADPGIGIAKLLRAALNSLARR